MATRLLRLFLAACSLRVAVDGAESLSHEKERDVLDIRMPGASVLKANIQLCHSVRLGNNTPMFITGFDPLIRSSMAHHATVSACSEPGRQDKIWNCGKIEVPEYGNGKICEQEARPTQLFTATMGADRFWLPHGVAFPVGAGTGFNVIVLRVHYKHSNATIADTSGVKLFLTTTTPAKPAGLLIVASNGDFQPRKLEHCEILCSPPIPTSEQLHIFAYRVHTHDLGLMVSGYRVRNGTWTEIGRRSPQLPQNYIPTDVVIGNGDYVAVRCTMFNFQSDVVRTGERYEDEMCVLYAFYYTESGSFIPELMCSSHGPPSYYWKLDKRLDVHDSPFT